jgi:hypothetical protein
MDPRLPFELKYPEAKKGLNKWTWDLKRQGLKCIPGITLFAGFDGPHVAPGHYSARLEVGDATQTVSFEVRMDPRIKASDEDIKSWSETLGEVEKLVNASLGGLEEIRQARQQIEALMAAYPDDASLQTTAAEAIGRINAWDGEIIQSLHQTYEDEDAWETKLAGQLRYLMDVIDETGAPVTGGALLRLEDLKSEWSQRHTELQAINTTYIDVINAWARQKGIPYVTSPGS